MLFRQQAFTVYATGHGPVMGSRNGDWLSLKENNRSLDALMQSWLRTKAKGFEDFKKIMNMRSNSSDNTVFADDKGNIAYWHGNFIPKRDPKLDWAQPVDGTTSSTEWKGLHSLDEMVHVYNPPNRVDTKLQLHSLYCLRQQQSQKRKLSNLHGTRS